MKMAPDLDHFFKTAVELFVYLFLQCGYGQSRFPLFLCYSMIVYKSLNISTRCISKQHHGCDGCH